MAAKKKSKKPAANKKAVTGKAEANGKKAAKAAPAKSDRRALAETVLRALTITVVADGEIAKEEEAILRRIANEDIFRGVDTRGVIAGAVKRCLDDGVDASLADIAKKLGSKDMREAALTTCIAVAAADGTVTASEIRLLRKIREAFGISTARAKSLAGPAAAVFA